jgi:hypothetical protein
LIYIIVIVEETGSKTQIPAFLLAILAMAERGGIVTSVVEREVRG